jgi:protoporphyrinogen oxidase
VERNIQRKTIDVGRGQSSSRNFILGAGVTGLGAAYESGWEVFEAATHPGGICSSYYLHPTLSSSIPGEEQNSFRFEIGGGHWLFGGNHETIAFFTHFVPLSSYSRRSSVYINELDLVVPYPLQNNLRYLPPSLREQVLGELHQPPKRGAYTMRDWLLQSFGPTLCDLFFIPFHNLYTAGLLDAIEPQDSYKSPVDVRKIIEGSKEETVPVGYNAEFRYPNLGLGALFGRIAEPLPVHYERRIVGIDATAKTITFADGETVHFDSVISTLPLNRVCELARFDGEPPDPFTSVLVLNIGATREKRQFLDHWMYFSSTKSGFHRVGSYSNVDKRFLPSSMRDDNNVISLYVEKAFLGGTSLSAEEMASESQSIIDELKELGIIRDVLVQHPTWIDVAYTWKRVGSTWRERMIQRLGERSIIQSGRFGAWRFQGIADSFAEGRSAGRIVSS